MKGRDCSACVGSESVMQSTIVHDLGVVYLDLELTMKQHVTKVAASCFYHLRRLRQIHRRVGKAVLKWLVLAFMTSCLDYCNSVLACLPRVALEQLQRVQHAAVRLILDFNLWSRDTGSASATLVANTLAYQLQVVSYHAVHSCWKMASLQDGVRSYCRWTHI